MVQYTKILFQEVWGLGVANTNEANVERKDEPPRCQTKKCESPRRMRVAKMLVYEDLSVGFGGATVEQIRHV